MKYLKKYKMFLEEVDAVGTSGAFDISNDDAPDLKMAKQKMETTQAQVKEYNADKPKIDALYDPDTDNDNATINTQLETLLGKDDVQKGVDRNPFLVEYANLARIKKQIADYQRDNVGDKIKLDDFQRELKETNEETTANALKIKIAEITKRMTDRITSINQIQADLLKSQKEHTDKMSKIEKDMKDYITKISNG
jgi:hypothetical protein